MLINYPNGHPRPRADVRFVSTADIEQPLLDHLVGTLLEVQGDVQPERLSGL